MSTSASPQPTQLEDHDVGPPNGPCFELLYSIQDGAFGSAWAARNRSTRELLCIKKFERMGEPQVARSIRTELRIFKAMMQSTRGERGRIFIMEFKLSILLNASVYFVMELMTTDLDAYLFSEPEECKLHARRWIAQIALGIESLHEMGILHRDIKSENILIDSRENIRIIDFGLSYLCPTGEPLRRGTKYAVDFVGTSQYMAPEVLYNKGQPRYRTSYGTAVDWWALGCILFELESGDHGFLFQNSEDVRAYINWARGPCGNGIYKEFEGLDPVVVNLLKGLLRVWPSARYCFEDIEKHDYFLNRNGVSEFDNAVVRASERPICHDLVPQQFDDHHPVEVVEGANSTSIFVSLDESEDGEDT